MRKKAVSRYLYREYAPCRNVEQFKDWVQIDVDVNSEALQNINGTFMLVSPNPQFDPSGNYHWFDGDGMIHAVKFEGGKVYYKCAFVQTEKYIREKNAQKNLYPGLLNPINRNGILSSTKRLLKYAILGENPFPNTSNTDLIWHNDKLLSMWFLSGKAYEINKETLETKGEYHFKPTESKSFTKHNVAPHPKVCPDTGELFFMDFSTSWKRFPKKHIVLGKVSKEGKLLALKKIKVSGSRVLHDLCITKNYIVIADVPVKPGRKGIEEDKGCVTRFGLISRNFDKSEGDWYQDTIWINDQEGYNILHYVNAYEERGNVFLWGLRNDSFSIISNAQGNSEHSSYLHKWVLSAKDKTMVENSSFKEYISEGVEFPTLNLNFVGKKNRFSYLAQIANASTFNYDGIIKFDHVSKEKIKYQYPKHEYCGEARFIGHESASSEDDGYLMTIVRSPKKKVNSKIEIFDAQSMGNGPVLQIELPNHIPVGFHTIWIPEA